MAALQIYDRRERALVAAGDAVLAAARGLARPFRRRSPPLAPKRILLLRLERIGDLVMALPAVADLRDAAPDAEIDLVVGSWNEELARAVRGVDRVETHGSGLARPRLPWRRASAAAPCGGRLAAAPLRSRDQLRTGRPQQPAARGLGGAVDGRLPQWWRRGAAGPGPRLSPIRTHHRQCAAAGRDRAADDAAQRRRGGSPGHPGGEPAAKQSGILAAARRPLVAMHVAGGRPVKQWDPDRFALVARQLAESCGATIVLTGSPEDAHAGGPGEVGPSGGPRGRCLVGVAAC